MDNFKNLQQREKQAMEHLKALSEAPWEIQYQKAENVQSPIKIISKNTNRSMSFRTKRPLTQQSTQRNLSFKFDIVQQKRLLAWQKIVAPPNSQIGACISFIEKFKKLNNYLQQGSQELGRMNLKKKTKMRNKDYSILRKTYERDFFVGSQSSNLQKNKDTPNNKSLKKGRIWLGRPMLLFNSHKQLKNQY